MTGGWEKICNSLHGLKPTLLMIMAQMVFAVVNVSYKLASNDGMRVSILVCYRFMFGAAVMLPLAFFIERKKRPKLTRTTAFYGFLCGLFGGSLGQNLFLKSLSLTSTTFAAATTNLIPAVTFIVASFLRLEKLGWKTAAGKAKVFGTILGISGAMLLTFYKGPVLNLWNTNINLLEITSSHKHGVHHAQTHHSSGEFILGALLGLLSCFCYSLWLIIQAKAAAKYPCPYSITAMMTVWASIQGLLFALCVERDWNQWKMGWDIRLLSVAVSGILGSGLMFTLVAWCVRMRGPLFVSVFNPLMLVLVAIAGSLFLEEKLHLGMLLGAILIIGSLYIVLWGKGRELKKVSQLMPDDEDPEQKQVQNDVDSSQPPRNGSSRSRSGRKESGDQDEERRDSHVSSEVIGGLYVYP